MFGMTPEQYWYDNPELYFNYKRAYDFKQKQLEQHIWLMANYNQQAITCSVVNVPGITDYKKYKVPNMPECPHTGRGNSLGMSQKEVENERLRAYAFFKTMGEMHKSKNK